MSAIDTFTDELQRLSVRFERNYPLSLVTTMRVGAPASVVVWVESDRQMESVIRLLMELEVDFRLIGRGSNLIIDDRQPFDEVFVVSGTKPDGFSISPSGVVEVYAGALLPALIHKVATWDLGGLEFLGGVPGTVGGAIVMNAGPRNWGICEFLEYVDVLTPSDGVVRVDGDQLEFGYRYCKLPVDGWILRAGIRFEDKPHGDIMMVIQSHMGDRRRKQPLDKPSAGSVFKNPPDIAAGYLIDKVGLKGYRVGGASISDKHANFIVNEGNASFEDIISLINLARREVWEEFGILLEPEVELIIHPDLREVTKLWDVQ